MEEKKTQTKTPKKQTPASSKKTVAKDKQPAKTAVKPAKQTAKQPAKQTTKQPAKTTAKKNVKPTAKKAAPKKTAKPVEKVEKVETIEQPKNEVIEQAPIVVPETAPQIEETAVKTESAETKNIEVQPALETVSETSETQSTEQETPQAKQDAQLSEQEVQPTETETQQTENAEEVVPMTRKEKRHAKLRKKLTNPIDIKYCGPLSYRYLRVIAWLAIAAGQIVFLNSVSQDALGLNMLNTTISTVLTVFSMLSFPLFLIAAFGMILKTSKNYKKILISYAISFLGIGLGLTLVYLRYVSSVLLKMGVDAESISTVGQLIGSKVDINVFSDLMAFALFHFFLNYTPTKHFLGKKVAIFRAFAILPILFVVGSYVIKVMFELRQISLPFYAFPFLTTKSPLVFALFSVISLLIKNRERTFRKIGLTSDEYQTFLKTKRNSLYFSITLSIVILIFAAIELVIVGAFGYNYLILQGMGVDEFINLLNAYGLGECLSMLFAIPIVFLYSYTKEHKGAMLDRLMPAFGILLIAFIYIEGLYRFIMIVA